MHVLPKSLGFEVTGNGPRREEPKIGVLSYQNIRSYFLDNLNTLAIIMLQLDQPSQMTFAEADRESTSPKETEASLFSPAHATKIILGACGKPKVRAHRNFLEATTREAGTDFGNVKTW